MSKTYEAYAILGQFLVVLKPTVFDMHSIREPDNILMEAKLYGTMVEYVKISFEEELESVCFEVKLSGQEVVRTVFRSLAVCNQTVMRLLDNLTPENDKFQTLNEAIVSHRKSIEAASKEMDFLCSNYHSNVKYLLEEKE